MPFCLSEGVNVALYGKKDFASEWEQLTKDLEMGR